jgi:ABC-type dipeptide/oligopeptide/nickel transport system permease subunit
MTFVALDRLSTGRVLGVLCAAAVVTFFAMGQAVTFSWLSALPEQASRLESLAWRFWTYATLSLVLLVIDLWVASEILRRLLRRVFLHEGAKKPTPGHAFWRKKS